jgi:hypothetical protein
MTHVQGSSAASETPTPDVEPPPLQLVLQGRHISLHRVRHHLQVLPSADTSLAQAQPELSPGLGPHGRQTCRPTHLISDEGSRCCYPKWLRSAYSVEHAGKGTGGL